MSTQNKPDTSISNILFDLFGQAGKWLDLLPPSRGRSMVGTKLDEAMLWLTQVALHESEQMRREGQDDEPFASAHEQVAHEAAIEWRNALKQTIPGSQEYARIISEMRAIIANYGEEEAEDDPFGIKAGRDAMEREQAKSGVEALSKYEEAKKGSTVRFPLTAIQVSATHWHNTFHDLDYAAKFWALRQMRSTISGIEKNLGVQMDAHGDYHRRKSHCTKCKDTGWVPRHEKILTGVPFSQNYNPCPHGCDGGRGHSDPIPYDPATGKIVTTDTEDDGA